MVPDEQSHHVPGSLVQAPIILKAPMALRLLAPTITDMQYTVAVLHEERHMDYLRAQVLATVPAHHRPAELGAETAGRRGSVLASPANARRGSVMPTDSTASTTHATAVDPRPDDKAAENACVRSVNAFGFYRCMTRVCESCLIQITKTTQDYGWADDEFTSHWYQLLSHAEALGSSKPPAELKVIAGGPSHSGSALIIPVEVQQTDAACAESHAIAKAQQAPFAETMARFPIHLRTAVDVVQATRQLWKGLERSITGCGLAAVSKHFEDVYITNAEQVPAELKGR